MKPDDKFWLSLYGMLFTAIVILVLGGCTIYNRHVEKMAELGYQKEPVVGTNHLVWKKVDCR